MITFSEDFKIYVLPWISLFVTGYIAWNFYHHVLCALHDKWTTRRLIRKKQREREYGFHKLEQRYSQMAVKEKITSLTEDQLLCELQQRKLSAVEVLDAFTVKALNETKKFNSVTEFIPQAHLWAAQLDELKEPKGPLHGLPISVKENCSVEGTDSTMGFGKNIHKPQDETCLLVRMLMDLGAVPFCKTNVPQSLFCWGCGNPIFGETKNCLNVNLGPGGSSGGESSLIGSGGSVLGIGTDAAGSVRIPAHFCGITSLKPSKMRYSPAGIPSASAAIIGLSGTPGLMSKSATLIQKVFKILTEDGFQKKYDRLTIPISWNEMKFASKRPLRIGYYTDLEFFPVIGDTEKVVMNAKIALESAGHKLIPIEPFDSFEVMKVFMDLAYADGGQFINKVWKDEPIAEAAIFHYLLSRIPKPLRIILAKIMSFRSVPFLYSKRVATVFQGGAGHSNDLMNAMAKRTSLMQKFAREWEKQDLDLLLCPTFPFAAVPFNYAGYLKPAIIHTLMPNLFDWPAGVVPFGKESGRRINEYDTEGDFLLKWALEGAKQSVGMPISVQLVGLPFQEELVLRGMIELEREYRNTQN